MSATRSGLMPPPGRSATMSRLARRRRNLAHGDAAELDEILRLEVARLADPDHHEARHVEPERRHDVERRAVLALEPVGRRGPPDQIAGRLERPAGGGAELEPLLTEHNKNALGGRRKRCKFELQGAGHDGWCPSTVGPCSSALYTRPWPTRSGPPRWGTDMTRRGAPCKAPRTRPARRRSGGPSVGGISGRRDGASVAALQRVRINVLLCIAQRVCLGQATLLADQIKATKGIDIGRICTGTGALRVR